MDLHVFFAVVQAGSIAKAAAPWPVLIVTLKIRTLVPVAERFIECTREAATLLAKG